MTVPSIRLQALNRIYDLHGGGSLWRKARQIPALAQGVIGMVAFTRDRYQPDHHYLLVDGRSDGEIVTAYLEQMQPRQSIYGDLTDIAVDQIVIVICKVV